MPINPNPVAGAGTVTVFYDGKTPWGEAVPFVQVQREPIFYGGKWGQVANISLIGQVSQWSYDDSKALELAGLWSPTLTYPQGLQNLENIRDDIIEVFSKNLKTFEFVDTGAHGMEFKNAIVEEIDFPASGYWGTLDFRITLKCYEIDYFMAQGVMDAVDEFQTTENENGTMTVSHRISARGFEYTDATGAVQHGLANAIAWVDSRKGSDFRSTQGIDVAWWGGTLSALGPAAGPKINLKLMSQDEKIDRLQGTYEVSETFLGYLDETNNVTTRTFGRKFTVDINESLDADFNVVTISGEYLGGKDTSLAELRQGFVGDNPAGNPALAAEPEKMLYEKARDLSGFDGGLIAAVGAVDGAGNPIPGAGTHRPLLYSIPLGFSLEENETEKSLKVKATFDTNSLFGDNRYFFNHKVNVQMEEVTNVTKVTVDGTLEVRGLSAEKQFYLKKFLENKDVMDFLWQAANEQHGLIGKTCWECKGGTDHDGNAIDHWIRTDIGGDWADAAIVCNSHPYGGAPDAAAVPDRCHELNRSASSISMIKNEVNNTLQLSASFDDEDTLEIKMKNPEDGTCFECIYPDGSSKIIKAADQAAADAECLLVTGAAGYQGAFQVVMPCMGAEIPTGKDYGKASFTVDVKSPIDYVKANASAQRDYNGHWAVQKFGIKTRERSSVKVDLEFREDAGVPSDYLEDTLRTQSKKIQETLNGMLDQNYAGPAGGPVPSPVYDVSESIRHKVTKGDKITHALERSYQPDEANAICMDISPIGDQKDCFMCKDSSGNITNSASLGDKVYVYPSSGYQAGAGYQYNQDTEAQALCDQMIGTKDVSGNDIVGPLTVIACTKCWQCWSDTGEMKGQVTADTATDAEAKCPAGTHAAVECDLSISVDCYECYGYDSNDEFNTLVYGPFQTILPQTAHDICTGYQGLPTDSPDVVASLCAPPTLACWECFYVGQDFGWVFADKEEDALIECAAVLDGNTGAMYPCAIDPTCSDLIALEGCDFQTFGTTPAP
jgi:hypothetical protein